MKKTIILWVIALVVVLSVVSLRFVSAEENGGGDGIWEYVSNLKRDLNYYAQVIYSLRTQVKDINERLDRLSPPEGGNGNGNGATGAFGAGNVAFIYKDGVGIHALRTDGTVWKWPASGWVPEGTSGIDVPVPVADIVEWQLASFLDKNGNLWRWSDGNWTNFGHP